MNSTWKETSVSAIPTIEESIPGALIDSARISVMAAAMMFGDEQPPPAILLPGEEPQPTVGECLAQAMEWLNAARTLSIEQAPAPPTSLHVVQAGGGRS